MKAPKWLATLSLVFSLVAVAGDAAAQTRSRRKPTPGGRALLDRSSRTRTMGGDRARRAQQFEKQELWQLAYIERLQGAVENPSGPDLARLGELMLVLGRFEDAGRLQSELLQKGVGPQNWPAAFRAAVAAHFLESGNAAAAVQALPGSIQNLMPRARVKAAVVAGAVHAARGQGASALEALTRATDGAGQADASLASLQRSRLLYEAGKLSEAMEELTTVPRSSPHWYPGLFVSAWSSYRAGDLNLALGLLMSMHTPYLRNKFNPESYVLEAATLYRLCHYPSALRSIQTLKDRYKGVSAAISRAGRQLEGGTSAVATVLAYASGGSSAPWGVDEGAWDLVADGLLSEPTIAEVGLSIEEAEKAEIYLKGAGTGAGTYARELERAKAEALRRGRRIMLSKINRMRAEANEALEGSLAIEVEINTRIRDRLAKGSLPKFKDVDFDAEINKGYEFWPYQGEYWRDEAGSYVFATTDVCVGDGESSL